MTSKDIVCVLNDSLRTLIGARVCGDRLTKEQQLDIENVIQSAIDVFISVQPKVMTQEELEALNAGNVVWLEQRDENDTHYLMPMIKYDDGMFENRLLGADPLAANLANTRFWSARPTEEESRNMPWT